MAFETPKCLTIPLSLHRDNTRTQRTEIQKLTLEVAHQEEAFQRVFKGNTAVLAAAGPPAAPGSSMHNPRIPPAPAGGGAPGSSPSLGE